MSSAAFAYPHKSAEAFRTISEVAIELDVPQHVLRFWESRFAQIRPVKRAGGRRYYRPEDIDLLKGIRALLYSDGLTIRGVQKILKERGLRHVAELGRGGSRTPEPQIQVVEKIIYIEKPAAGPVPPPPVPKPAKKRASHLRAVPDTLDLPFFDFSQETPSREFPVLDAAPVGPAAPPVVEAVVESDVAAEPEITVESEVALKIAVEPVAEAVPEMTQDDGLPAQDRARLDELLDELTGLKIRLQAAREVLQK
ncbi:MAG TPA: MerR family transcriptional regulator [Rhizomicrobium sp.]|jgi:DNA-binding transcriptional MerR regulator|nr:MerR family transcriptional regulator [Rhizomicrobium sp.]